MSRGRPDPKFVLCETTTDFLSEHTSTDRHRSQRIGVREQNDPHNGTGHHFRARRRLRDPHDADKIICY